MGLEGKKGTYAAIGTAVAGPVGGIVGYGMGGAEDAAQAAQDAAMAQLEASREQRAAARGAAQPTSAELLAQNQMLQETAKSIDRQNALLDATDPALREAGVQALKLLRGEQAQALQPMEAGLNRQQEELAQRLTAQLGGGALQTTAGQRAFTEFQNQAEMTKADAQLKYLGQLLGTTAQVRPNPYQATQAYNEVLGRLGDVQNRQISAINATDITPYTGAPFVGEALRGQYANQMSNKLIDAGVTLASSAAKGK